ncbi:MAG TPA: PmoA family protein, partial [Candidatus Brocadiia bacterium]|nr:PmoA family protein [Candidatus Brocadiia bacterium]
MTEQRFQLLSGPRSRRLCLASVAAPDVEPGAWEVVDAASGVTAPAQIEGGRAWWMAEDLAAECRREMTLRPAAAPQAARVGVANGDAGVNVVIRGDRFTSYRFAGVARPYLSPLAGPFGAAVTRRWPMEESPSEKHDHPHHKGCWVAWGDVNGADNWSEQPGHGFVAHQRFMDLSSGPVFGRIAAVNHWTDRDGRKLMTEEREYRFYDTPRGARFFDVAVTFLADAGDVRFGDTKEGGIASVRVASSMDASGRGRIVNSFGGINEGEAWGKRAQWCDYSGPVEGELA